MHVANLTAPLRYAIMCSMNNGYVPLASLADMIGVKRDTLLVWAKRFAHDDEFPSGLRHASPAPTSPWQVTDKWARWCTTMCTDYVGVVAAAELLNKARTTIYKWRLHGYIKGYRHPNGEMVFSLVELERYIDTGLADTPAPPQEETEEE